MISRRLATRFLLLFSGTFAPFRANLEITEHSNAFVWECVLPQ
jgi:hypothetical protein